MEATSELNLLEFSVVQFLRRLVEIIFDKSIIKRLQYNHYYPECLTIEGKPMKNLLREIWRSLHGESNKKDINDILIRDAFKVYKKNVSQAIRKERVQRIIDENSY